MCVWLFRRYTHWSHKFTPGQLIANIIHGKGIVQLIYYIMYTVHSTFYTRKKKLIQENQFKNKNDKYI